MSRVRVYSSPSSCLEGTGRGDGVFTQPCPHLCRLAQPGVWRGGGREHTPARIPSSSFPSSFTHSSLGRVLSSSFLVSFSFSCLLSYDFFFIVGSLWPIATPNSPLSSFYFGGLCSVLGPHPGNFFSSLCHLLAHHFLLPLFRMTYLPSFPCSVPCPNVRTR